MTLLTLSARCLSPPQVKPPRLDGGKTGLFATRTPHRPNNLGLSLVRLDSVKGDTLHLSGVDLVDGTPTLTLTLALTLTLTLTVTVTP